MEQIIYRLCTIMYASSVDNVKEQNGQLSRKGRLRKIAYNYMDSR